MSEEEKTSIWTKIGNFGKAYGALSVIIGGLVGIGVVFSNRIFSDKETRERTERFVKESPGPEEQWKALWLDSVNNSHAIKSRALRDSIFIEQRKDIQMIKEEIRKQDSFNIRNADQIFQIKEEIKNSHD